MLATKMIYEPKGPRANGFTLIELMVVIFIVGLAAGAVVLSMPGGDAAAKKDAEMFAVRLAGARDMAIMQAKPIRVWVSQTGYGFQMRQDGAWQAAPDALDKARDWNQNVDASISDDGQMIRIIDQSGMPSAPFALSLKTKDGATWKVELDGAGKVAMHAR